MANSVDTEFFEAIKILSSINDNNVKIKKSEIKMLVTKLVTDFENIYCKMKTEINKLTDKVKVCESPVSIQVSDKIDPKQVSYAEITSKQKTEKKNNTHKLIVSGNENNNLTTAEVKTLVQKSFNPCKLQVGIVKLKETKNNKIIIETENKVMLEKICQEINVANGKVITAEAIQKHNPRLIVFNIPSEVTLENVTEIIREQNLNTVLQNDTIIAKQIWKNRYNNCRNLIIEVNPSLRKRLLKTKIRMTWNICFCADYISVTRCFNHVSKFCKNDVKCCYCSEAHDSKLCEKIDKTSEHNCSNCIHLNRISRGNKVDTNHSAKSKLCPSYNLLVKRKQENINYDDE